MCFVVYNSALLLMLMMICDHGAVATHFAVDHSDTGVGVDVDS